MSNLFKSFNVNMDQQDRVIDCNAIISEKIIEVRNAMTAGEFNVDGFTAGLGAVDISEMLGEEDHLIGDLGSDETVVEEKIPKKEIIIAEAQAEADAIVERANEDAQAIIAAAQVEAENIKIQAMNEGMAEGLAKGRSEAEEVLAEKEQELAALEQELYATYRAKEEQMEPALVDTILKIFADFTGAIALDKKDMILTLVNNVMSGGEVGSNFIIRACDEDAAYLREHRDEIVGAIRKDVHIEIVSDMSMKKNQCLLDTDMGIFDCSLDVQMENLINDIKILSATV